MTDIEGRLDCGLSAAIITVIFTLSPFQLITKMSYQKRVITLVVSFEGNLISHKVLVMHERLEIFVSEEMMAMSTSSGKIHQKWWTDRLMSYRLVTRFILLSRKTGMNMQTHTTDPVLAVKMNYSTNYICGITIGLAEAF
jgi:hypothetical protein